MSLANSGASKRWKSHESRPELQKITHSELARRKNAAFLMRWHLVHHLLGNKQKGDAFGVARENQ